MNETKTKQQRPAWKLQCHARPPSSFSFLFCVSIHWVWSSLTWNRMWCVRSKNQNPSQLNNERRDETKNRKASWTLSRTILSHSYVVCLFSLLLSLSLVRARLASWIYRAHCAWDPDGYLCVERELHRSGIEKRKKAHKKQLNTNRRNWRAKIDEKTRNNQANERVNEKLLSHAELVKFRSRMHHTRHELWPTKFIWIRV